MGKLQELKDKAAEFVADHREKIDDGLDKVSGSADGRTEQEHTDKIDNTPHTVGGKLDQETGGSIGDNQPPTPAPSAPSVSDAVPSARDSAVSPEVIMNPSPDATAEGTQTAPHERTQ